MFLSLHRKPINKNEMNTPGEVLNYKKAMCREIYIPDLMSLLRSSGPIFMSWGACDFTVDNKNSPKVFRMRVSGHHHKGFVYIFLNGMDLFDVYLTTSKNIIKERTEEEGLYFDQLVEWIDDRIEKISSYSI